MAQITRIPTVATALAPDSWTSESNALTQGGGEAANPSDHGWLRLDTMSGGDVPMDATITGLEILGFGRGTKANAVEPPTATDEHLEWCISLDGATPYSDICLQAVNASGQYLDVGGPTDLLGRTWSVANANDPDFCVMVRRPSDAMLCKYPPGVWRRPFDSDAGSCYDFGTETVINTPYLLEDHGDEFSTPWLNIVPQAVQAVDGDWAYCGGGPPGGGMPPIPVIIPGALWFYHHNDVNPSWDGTAIVSLKVSVYTELAGKGFTVCRINSSGTILETLGVVEPLPHGSFQTFTLDVFGGDPTDLGDLPDPFIFALYGETGSGNVCRFEWAELRIDVTLAGQFLSEDLLTARYVDYGRAIIHYASGGGTLTMPRETVRQRIQIGIESTAGSQVSAPKRLRAAILNPAMNPEFRGHRPQGEKLHSNHLLNREWSTSPVNGMPTYDELGYLLGMIIGAPTSVGGTPDQLNQHVFRYDNRGEQHPQTITCEYGESTSRAHSVKGMSLTELGIEMRRAECVLSGSAVGSPITDGITMTAGQNDVQTITIAGTGTYKLLVNGIPSAGLAHTANAAAIQTALNVAGLYGTSGCAVTGTGPYVVTANGVSNAGKVRPLMTVDNTGMSGGSVSVAHTTVGGPVEMPLVPILPEDITVYLSDTYGTLSSNKMTDVSMSNLNITGRQNPYWVLDASNVGYKGLAEGTDEVARFAMKAQASSQAMALLGTGRSDAKKFIRIECIGPLIGVTADTHKLVIEACIKVSGFGALEDEDGIYMCNYELSATEDASWGNSIVVRLENGVIGSTYGP